jgi:group I intron endonuclease
MTESYVDSRKVNLVSSLTKYKISKSLTGKKHSLSSKLKMSLSRSGINNPYFGKKLPSKTIEAARQVRGKTIYVYLAKDLSLINNLPFPSIREVVKYLPISSVTLKVKLNTGIAFKGYYYYSNPLNKLFI